MASKKRPNGYWTKDKCYEAAKGCKTRREFGKKYSAAYCNARKNGWLKDYTWFLTEHEARSVGNRRSKYSTYEACYEEAKKYKKQFDFVKGCPPAYQIAYKNGWLKDYTWFEPRFLWDYDKCYEEAKKYKTRSEFMAKASGAYAKAKDNGWLKDYTWFMSRHDALSLARTYWTEEKCLEVAKTCKSKSEFGKKYNGAYIQALANGWIKDYTWFKRRNREGNVYYVYAYEDIENKYVYVGLTCDFKRRDREHRKGISKHGVIKYDYLHKYFNGNIPEGKILIDMVTPEEAQYYEGYYAEKYIEEGWTLINKAKTGSLGTGVVKWNYDTCMEEAKKYKTRGEFAIKSKGAYDCARMNGWLDDYTWFDKAFIWTPDACYEEAKKYKTKDEFRINAPGAYMASHKYGWIKGYDWFVSGRHPRKWTKEVCENEAKKYETSGEFQRNNPCGYQASLRHGWLKEFFPKAA